MQCPRCNLRYNTHSRAPLSLHCGHSLCCHCLSKVLLCPLCQQLIDKRNTKSNHALLELIKSKSSTSGELDKLVKVCFVGESQVGKTSLIRRLKGQEYKQNTIPTIGYDFAFQDRRVEDLNVRFQLWDSAGQERYRAISPLHYKNSDILVLVYDVNKSGKDNKVWEWLEEAQKHCPSQCVKVVLGNKIDLLDSHNGKQFNSLDEQTWLMITKEGIGHYQVSCKTYDGIEEFWHIMEQNVTKIIGKAPQPEKTPVHHRQQPPSRLVQERGFRRHSQPLGDCC